MKNKTNSRVKDIETGSGTKELSGRKWVSTCLLDDVFTDEVSLFKPHFEVDYEGYLQRLWESNPDIYELLKKSGSLEEARESLYTYLEKAERKVFQVDNDLHCGIPDGIYQPLSRGHRKIQYLSGKRSGEERSS